MNNHRIKTLVAKVKSQHKTFKKGISNQTVDEIAQAFDSLLKGRESYIEIIRLTQDAIKSKDKRIAELFEKEREDLRVRLSKAETESCEAKAIRDLEQQAKGLTDYAKTQEQGIAAVWMISAASKLLKQAKAKVLKEKGK